MPRFMKLRPVAAELFRVDERTDGWTDMTSLIFAARMCDERGGIGSCWGNWRERGHWGDLGVDGWIILR